MFVGLVPRVSGWCATPYMPWPWKQQEAGSIPSEKALGWRVARRLAAQRAAAAAPAAAAMLKCWTAAACSPQHITHLSATVEGLCKTGCKGPLST
jgi:hypothetical protein